MRRHIVIGLLAVVVVIGVIALFVSQPRRGSVEWHKREYLKARDGSRFLNNLKVDWYRRGGPRPKPRIKTPDMIAEMEIHERALMALGYMEERTIEARFGGAAALSSLTVAFAMNSRLRKKVIVERPIARVVHVGPDFVVVRSARHDMPKWETAVDGRKPAKRR